MTAGDFIHECRVYVSRKSREVIVPTSISHGGLWTEDLRGVVERGNLLDAAATTSAICRRFDACKFGIAFQHRDTSIKDWAAFQVSKRRSVSQFEREYVLHEVRSVVTSAKRINPSALQLATPPLFHNGPRITWYCSRSVVGERVAELHDLYLQLADHLRRAG